MPPVPKSLQTCYAAPVPLGMLNLSPPLPRKFHEGFEVMPSSDSIPHTVPVRFFVTDDNGHQVGKDFTEDMDSLTFLIFMCHRGTRGLR